MRVISRKALREFWERHADAEKPLRAWLKEANEASWKRPSDIKARYATASFLANGRVVFNIKGNAYRLVVARRMIRKPAFSRAATARRWGMPGIRGIG